MEDANIVLFFGRFHPLLVHLPIGFLLLAVIFEIAERFGLAKGLKSAVSFTLLLGTLSAIAASALGLLLATSGDYNEDMLGIHQWAGIVTTVVSGVAYLLSAGHLKLAQLKDKLYYGVLGVLVIGLGLTGHMGGNLTHGSDYLTYYMPFKPVRVDPLARPQVTDIQQAQLFGDLIHPILMGKCKSCHNEEKQKGRLSFTSIEGYLKGGKHGDLIVAGDPLSSELIKRVTLSPSHEDFMPPEGKTPLTEEEIALLTFWISQGQANFDTLLMALAPDETVLAAAHRVLNLKGHRGEQQIQLAELPEGALTNLRGKGFEIRELIAGSHAYEVSLTSKASYPTGIGELVASLESIKENILWLSLPKTGLQDGSLDVIGEMKYLQKLDLKNNQITDAGIERLGPLEELMSINLYGNPIGDSSISKLSQFPKLNKIYVWQTKITSDELTKLRQEFKHLTLVAGI